METRKPEQVDNIRHSFAMNLCSIYLLRDNSADKHLVKQHFLSLSLIFVSAELCVYCCTYTHRRAQCTLHIVSRTTVRCFSLRIVEIWSIRISYTVQYIYLYLFVYSIQTNTKKKIRYLSFSASNH